MAMTKFDLGMLPTLDGRIVKILAHHDVSKAKYKVALEILMDASDEMDIYKQLMPVLNLAKDK
jgi:hypothetical protein